jgi:cytochrome c-type biogenesis protein
VDPLTSGIILLSFYSLGLALPFFASSLAINSFLSYFKKIRSFIRLIPIISGILLIGVGVLLVTDYFTYLVNLLIRFFPLPA